MKVKVVSENESERVCILNAMKNNHNEGQIEMKVTRAKGKAGALSLSLALPR